MSYLTPLSEEFVEGEVIRVLHVDDHREFAEMSSAFLEREKEHLSIVIESSAQTAIERLNDESFDCVISDFDMPGMTGLEFLRELRRDHADLPFLLYTGKGSEEIASEAISAGVTDYIQKESSADHYTVLANRIENVVSNVRSQHAVETTEQYLHQIAERTDDILYMFGGAWQELLFINSAYEDVWGGSIEELRDEPLSFLTSVHPDDREIISRAAEGLLRGEDQTIEFRLQREEREEKWVRSDATPMVDAEGTVHSITGFVRDISDRKEREREMAGQVAAIEAAADGIAILDENAEFVFMNQAHAAIYGFESPDELIGESWHACYESDEVGRIEERISPALAETGHWQGEFDMTTAAGERITQWLSLTRIDDGRIVCVVRKRIEERDN